MPSGAKKRKAMQKKKQHEAITNNGFNGGNLHGHDENESQDERNTDSNLSSPGSIGNEEFGTKDPPAAVSSNPVKDSSQVISGDTNVTQELGPKLGNAIAVERGMDDKNNLLENSSNSSSENCSQTAKNVAYQDASDKPFLETSPVVDSVPKVVISEKSEHVETSPHSNLVMQKSKENEEYASPELEKENTKVITLPKSAAGTSKQVESVRESEVPVSLEEKIEKDNIKVVTLPRSDAGTSQNVESVRESEAPVSFEENVESFFSLLHHIHLNSSFELTESPVIYAASFTACSTSYSNFVVKLLWFV